MKNYNSILSFRWISEEGKSTGASTYSLKDGKKNNYVAPSSPIYLVTTDCFSGITVIKSKLEAGVN